MRYVRLYNDESGQARFEDREVSFAPAVFAPPAPPLDVSSPEQIRELMFIRFSAGWTDSAHPSPARQWMFVLSGRGETVAGGETRPWGSGDVFLLEDTTAPGHATSVFEDTIMAVARL
jgi:hypothetical protein